MDHGSGGPGNDHGPLLEALAPFCVDDQELVTLQSQAVVLVRDGPLAEVAHVGGAGGPLGLQVGDHGGGGLSGIACRGRLDVLDADDGVERFRPLPAAERHRVRGRLGDDPLARIIDGKAECRVGEMPRGGERRPHGGTRRNRRARRCGPLRRTGLRRHLGGGGTEAGEDAVEHRHQAVEGPGRGDEHEYEIGFPPPRNDHPRAHAGTLIEHGAGGQAADGGRPFLELSGPAFSVAQIGGLQLGRHAHEAHLGVDGSRLHVDDVPARRLNDDIELFPPFDHPRPHRHAQRELFQGMDVGPRIAGRLSAGRARNGGMNQRRRHQASPCPAHVFLRISMPFPPSGYHGRRN